MEKLFGTKYGYFTNDGDEFVITTVRTPRPWVNIVSNEKYGFALSNAGSGYSWLEEAGLNMINRWEQDLVRDDWGKYVYVRDDDRNNLWSLTYQPALKKPRLYECRHGVGYTTVTSLNYGIRSKLTAFVPQDDPLEVWLVEIENTSNVKRRISLFTYLEWGLGKASDWHREFHRVFIETKYDRNLSAIFAGKRLWDLPDKHGLHWNRSWEFVAFHSSSVPARSFTCDKEAFIGTFGNLKEPIAVKKGILAGEQGKHTDSIGSLHVQLTLNPKEKKSVVFVLGAAQTKEKAMALARKYKSTSVARRQLDNVKKPWLGYLEKCRIETPDRALDLMHNVWLKYQAISARMWGRTGYYQIGGAFGYRDQLQDSLLWLPIDPSRCRKQILLHAAHQFKDGTVYHWWHPITDKGLHSRYSDDLLWLVFVTAEYLKETKDYSILSEKVKYLDAPRAALFEHLKAAVDRALARFSKRGLPLILEGDWNDGLSAVGRKGAGESAWMGHFLCGILSDFSRICERRRFNRLAKNYGNRAQALKQNINKYCWDGEWYWRATCDDGTILGSRRSKEGKIFLNAQSWSVINDTAPAARARIAMKSAERILNREFGPLLLYPAYTKPDSRIGYITRYAPGARENAGMYTHAGTWYIWALTSLGKGDTAYKTLCRILPAHRGMKPDVYKAEPYVTPGNVDGVDSANFGQGGWTWYTGSAAWLFKVTLERILGVRPTENGLVVDPCVPKKWKRYTLKRNFRGATYLIEVLNSKGMEKGVKEVIVDNKRIKGSLLPDFRDGKTHRVKVIMG